MPEVISATPVIEQEQPQPPIGEQVGRPEYVHEPAVQASAVSERSEPKLLTAHALADSHATPYQSMAPPWHDLKEFAETRSK